MNITVETRPNCFCETGTCFKKTIKALLGFRAMHIKIHYNLKI